MLFLVSDSANAGQHVTALEDAASKLLGTAELTRLNSELDLTNRSTCTTYLH